MFTRLKEYIEMVNRVATRTMEANVGGCETVAYINAIRDITNNSIMEDIIKEIETEIINGRVMPYGMLKRLRTKYYSMRLGIHEMPTAGVVCEDDGSIVTIWVFGLSDDIVLKIEYASHYQGGHEYVDTDIVQYEYPASFVAIMKAFFNNNSEIW